MFVPPPKTDLYFEGHGVDLSSFDFANHADLRGQLVGVNVSCIVLILFVVGLRAIVRVRVVRSFGAGLDDGEWGASNCVLKLT